jgi:hypothetical protein
MDPVIRAQILRNKAKRKSRHDVKVLSAKEEDLNSVLRNRAAERQKRAAAKNSGIALHPKTEHSESQPKTEHSVSQPKTEAAEKRSKTSQPKTQHTLEPINVENVQESNVTPNLTPNLSDSENVEEDAELLRWALQSGLSKQEVVTFMVGEAEKKSRPTSPDHQALKRAISEPVGTRLRQMADDIEIENVQNPRREITRAPSLAPSLVEKDPFLLIVNVLLPPQLPAKSGLLHANFVVPSNLSIQEFQEYFFSHFSPYCQTPDNLVAENFTWFPSTALDHASRLDFMTEVELVEACWKLSHPSLGLQCGDHKHHRKVYANAFMGRDAIDWAIDRVPAVHNKRQALRFFRTVMSAGVISNPLGNSAFENSAHIYVLEDVPVFASVSPLESTLLLAALPAYRTNKRDPWVLQVCFSLYFLLFLPLPSWFPFLVSRI